MGNTKSNTSKQKKYFVLLLPSELLEIISFYLQIQDYYRLATSNQLLYGILWNNERMWSKLLERDGLLSIPKLENTDSNYCESCRNIYARIFNACLEFEEKLTEPIVELHYIYDPRSECMEVNTYMVTENYSAFEKLFKTVNKFEELLFILKYRKKSMVLRGYIAMNGTHPYNEDFKKEYTQIAQFLEQEKEMETVKQQLSEDEYEDRTIYEIFLKTHGSQVFDETNLTDESDHVTTRLIPVIYN